MGHAAGGKLGVTGAAGDGYGIGIVSPTGRAEASDDDDSDDDSDDDEGGGKTYDEEEEFMARVPEREVVRRPAAIVALRHALLVHAGKWGSPQLGVSFATVKPTAGRFEHS
jgi:hypothetical protein